MATSASTANPGVSSGFAEWFGQFLKSELAPYPGRGVTVARMVIAATLTTILVMTFRISGGAVGALYAFLISRDSLYATLQSAATIVISYTAGILFLLAGASLFASEPVGKFLWFAGSLFVVFFVLRTMRNFSAATGFAILVTNALPIWQLGGSAEAHLEATLWLSLSVVVGTAVTVGVEILFHAFYTKDELFEGLDNRWTTVIRLLRNYAEDKPVPTGLRNDLTQYAMIGVSTLRRMLARSVYERQYREQMTAVVGLTGRLSDIASTLSEMPCQLLQGDAQRVSILIRRIEEIRRAIADKQAPPLEELPPSAPTGIPLLPEVERTVALIPKVFSGAESVAIYVPTVLDDHAETSFFVRDAFSNYEHVKFALRGCLAGTLCYFFYSVLDWSALATSVTTCVLTALTNIGSSRQKQVLRITGAIAGGLIFGLGAQVWVLPNIDSIVGFALLFAAVTTVGAWFATASPRLSYFGIQLALGFDLIHLQEFTIQTSLSVARDRVVGILLGLAMMWIVFDQIWAKRAAQEMAGIFTANIRLIAEFALQAAYGEPESRIKKIRTLRNTIYGNFQAVNAQADAIPFEFGRQRALHMTARDHIRRWQPALRTLYLLLVASLQHRVFGEDAEFPKPLLQAHDDFHQACARIFEAMAGYLDGNEPRFNREEVVLALGHAEENLEQAVHSVTGPVRARAEGLLNLSRQITPLVEDFFRDITATPLSGLIKT